MTLLLTVLLYLSIGVLLAAWISHEDDGDLPQIMGFLAITILWPLILLAVPT